MTKTSSKTDGGILETVHKTASDLHRAGLIDKATVREFDALCLTSVKPEKITALRARGRV